MLTVFENGDSTRISEQELTIPKARQLAALLSRGLLFAKLLRLEKQKQTGIEAAVIEVEVELAQKTVHPIHQFEPLAILFDPKDQLGQVVLALREGFPITPHQSISPRSEPRTLCLYEEPYAEQKLRWSPFALIERARDWLRLTARGELHEEDQQMELLHGPADATAILPHDFHSSLAGDGFTAMSAARFQDLEKCFAMVVPRQDRQKCHPPEFVLGLFVTRPAQHGIITHQPTTLLQLHEFCQTISYDLLKELQYRLKKWKGAGNADHFAKSQLIICLVVPKLRHAASQPESRETWLFVTAANLTELCSALGVLDNKRTLAHAGFIIGDTPIEPGRARELQILSMRPTLLLDRESAATLNGTTVVGTKIFAIGLGALGSHVFDNLAKSGFGSWTLVDKDVLLPHNCARHTLDRASVPMPKVDMMLGRAKINIADLPVEAIAADILEPGSQTADIEKSAQAAAVILNMSASVAVSKHIALDLKSPARLASTFLNPSGDTLVLFIEDQRRTVPLDWLETQYYMALTVNDTFADHFKSPGRVRYSRSCGDISSRISQDLIAVHAATASRALRAGLASPAAMLLLCKAQPDYSTKSHVLPVNAPLVEPVGEWTFLTNPDVITEAHRLRHTKLPTETGGVLLGSIDAAHRRIYVTGLLPSPSDSKERPNLYIRGAAGLYNRVREISHATYDNIGYIGEWHSHPPRCTPNTSRTDRTTLSKLADYMSLAGLPALMLIVADHNRHRFHLASI